MIKLIFSDEKDSLFPSEKSRNPFLEFGLFIAIRGKSK